MLLLCCTKGIRKIIFLILISICIYPAISLANESPGPNAVTLQQVLENITKTDPAILEALKQFRSVEAERSIATSEYFPTIGTELSAGPERTKGVPTDDVEENLLATSATLFARQNLYSGGKTTAFVGETDARILAAAYEVLNVANTVYLDISEAYINVLKAKKLLKVAEENALTQERIMRQVREKTEAGFNRVSELYNSESRLVLSKGSYISREQDLNQALVIFHRLFGRLLNVEQFIQPEPSYQIPATISDTIDNAFKSHPALKVAHYNIETRRYTFEKASAAYFPTLDVELRGQYRADTGGEEGETTQSGAYLTLNYTFFDGGARKGAKARDQQSIRKEYQRAYIERRNVNETVRLAWNIMEAEDYKKGYLGEHVTLSAKTLDAFKDEYYVGRRTLLDLLNMENEYTQAQISLTESEYSHLISLYRLMQATGGLLAEHDTGLRKMLHLPEEKDSNREEYIEQDGNRDQDMITDLTDQCDNSTPHSSPQFSGCAEVIAASPGYPHGDESNISPYIAPLQSETSPVINGTIETAEVNLPPTGLVLEMKANTRELTGEAKDQLQVFTEILNSTPKTNILIEGYTASDINSDENIDLSVQRAHLVKEFMLNQGIAENRLKVRGRGVENPIAGNDTREGRRMNRRVEISVTEKQ